MQGHPPVRPLLDLLPFSQLSWEQFEAAVRDLFRRLAEYQNVESYGVRGDHQDGIDLRADDANGHVGVQCKRVDEFRAGDARAAVTAATYRADRFVLALSRLANVGVRHVIDPLPNWEVWDQQRLSDIVRSLTHAEAAEYVARHFDPAWMQAFLERAAPSTFIDRARTIAPLLDSGRLVHHAWIRVDDGGALDALRAFIGSEQRVALVDGPIGSGKSKIAFDVTAADLRYPVYFLVGGASISLDGLHEIRPGPALIIVDNADDADGIPLLFSHLLRDPDQKAILTASPGAVSMLDQQLARAEIEPAQIARVSLGRLSRAATVALVRQVFERENAEAEEPLVQHASDSPLTTILTARMIRDRSTTAQALESEGQVRDHVRARYREVATGAVDDDAPPTDVRAALQLLAALGPTRIDRGDFLNSAALFLGWDVDRLLGVLGAIEDARILHRRGGTYTVAPDMLRQSLLLEACIARGRRTTFPDRVLEAFPDEMQVLQNLAIADLESRAIGGLDLFSSPWRAVTERIRAGTSLERSHFISQLDVLGLFKPDEVFELVDELIRFPAANDDTQPYAQFGHTVEHRSVIRAVPAALRHVIMSSRERVRDCISLLWEIGKDASWPHANEGPIRTVVHLAEYGIGVGAWRAAAILDAVTAMIASGEPDTPKHSLLEMIEPILARDIHSSLSQGVRLTIRRLVVDVNLARELRDRAIGVVVEAAIGMDGRRAVTAIRVLADILREPEHYVAEPPEESRAPWDHEREQALDAFDQIVDSGVYPIRELCIADRLNFPARHSPSELVRARAALLLERIGTRNDRNRFLLPELCHIYKFHERDEDDCANANRRSEAFESHATAQTLGSFPEPEALVADLRTRLAAIEAAGLHGSPRALLIAIARTRPDLDGRFIEAILAVSDPMLYSWLEPFLRAAFIRNAAEGEALAERLLALEQPSVDITIANALVYISPRSDRDRIVRRDLLRRLLTHENIDVRRAAANTLFYFRHVNEDDIPGLASSADIGSDAELAERVYRALPNDLAGMDEVSIDALVAKLIPLTALEYWPMTFLARLAPTRSALVLNAVERRLLTDNCPDGYLALPFAPHDNFPLMEALAASPTFEDEVRAMIHERGGENGDALTRMTTFLGHIADVRPEFVKSMITDALASPSGELQRAGLAWIRRVPHTLLENDTAFVVVVLERAHRIGHEMGQRAEGAITAELITGGSFVTAYAGAPGDLRLQAVATAALARGDLSVPVRRFFTSLNEHGRSAERATIQRAEEAFGPP